MPLQTQCSVQHVGPSTSSSVQATLSFNYCCFLLFFILIKSDLLTISREIMSGKCLPVSSSGLWKERYESCHRWMCQAAPSFRQQQCTAIGTGCAAGLGEGSARVGPSTWNEHRGRKPTGWVPGRSNRFLGKLLWIILPAISLSRLSSVKQHR